VDPSLILAQGRRGDPVIKLVGIGESSGNGLVKCGERVGWRFGRQPQAYDIAPTSRHLETVIGCGFGPAL
jgi:hypothetical protein